MQNRDFKGVWISKEIWLDSNLSALDKVLLAEISSLDNEKHCFASNEYFAEFCDVGTATITRSIKKLKELGYIECEMVKNESGSYRLIKMITRGSNQNDDTPLIKMISNYNTINNNINTDISSKDNISSEPELDDLFQFGIKKPSKPNLYQKCMMLIDEWTDIQSIHDLLKQYLDLCMEMKSIRGANQWKGMLNTLEKVQRQCHPHTYEEIIQMSIQYGWKTFHPINDNHKGISGKRFDDLIRKDEEYDNVSHAKSDKEF